MKKLFLRLSLVSIFLYIGIILFVGNIHAKDLTTETKPVVYASWAWQGADIRSVFNHISEISGVDFVLDPNVSGKITLSIRDKNWRDVCEIVCRMSKLIAIPEEDYIYVMLEREFIKQREKRELDKRHLTELKPLEREIIRLSNTTAREMVEPVRGLLSDRGKITIVEHTNSLIILDTRENISKVKILITKLDIEVEQITISAKIIEVSSGVVNDIGIQWSLFDDRILHLPTDSKGEGIIATALEKASYGIISPKNYSLALEYLFSEGRSNIVAQPQITTLDNKEARIFMGSKVPVTYQDRAGNTLVKMIDAGTELVVKPHITSEGRIMMELKPTKKSYVLTDMGVPIVNEQSAQTNVVVNDGETVVIAGLTSNEEHESEGGIPFLKDIPVVGYLFKKSRKTKDKKDLIIFVTPHIIKREISSVSEKDNDDNIEKDTISTPEE